MSNTCNVKELILPHGSLESDAEWATVYLNNEVLIESGSAFFAQGFAEAMGIVADVELHDLGRATMRRKSIDRLLGTALKKYEESVALDESTGLMDFHQGRLRDAGITPEVLHDTLRTAFANKLLLPVHGVAEEVLREWAIGYRGLMQRYLDRLRDIVAFVRNAELSPTPTEYDQGVAWQEFSWSLTTRMAEALAFGQAIAALNTLALRERV